MNQNQQDFEKLFRNELEAVPFEFKPEELIFFKPIFKRILTLSSLYELDTDIETHTKLWNELKKSDTEPGFNLFNISCLLNTLPRKNPLELGVEVSFYNQILQDLKVLTDRWNALVTPIRTKLMNKLQTQAALQVKNNGMNVIPGKGR